MKLSGVRVQDERARGKASAQELKLKIARYLFHYFMRCISAPSASRLRDSLGASGARGEPTAPRRAAQAPCGCHPAVDQPHGKGHDSSCDDVVKGVLCLRLWVQQNLVPALLFLQRLLANSQVEDMCPSRAVVRPVLNLTLQLICCNVQCSIRQVSSRGHVSISGCS